MKVFLALQIWKLWWIRLFSSKNNYHWRQYRLEIKKNSLKWNFLHSKTKQKKYREEYLQQLLPNAIANLVEYIEGGTESEFRWVEVREKPGEQI